MNRLPDGPILMVVAGPDIPDLKSRLVDAVSGGVNLIQYRDRSASTEERIHWLCEMKALVPAVRIVVNGDIAASGWADGVHLPAGEISTYRNDRPVETERLAGVSIHTSQLPELTELTWRPDYLLFGTVYQSLSHPGGPVSGLDGLRQAVAQANERWPDMPVLVIGGIDGTNAAGCVRAGAAGVAVIRSVLLAQNPAAAAEGILCAMREAR